MLISNPKISFFTFFSVENPVDNVNNFFVKKHISLHNIFKKSLLFAEFSKKFFTLLKLFFIYNIILSEDENYDEVHIFAHSVTIHERNN